VAIEIRAEWAAQLGGAEVLATQHYHQLDAIQRELWQAWRASQGEGKESSVRSVRAMGEDGNNRGLPTQLLEELKKVSRDGESNFLRLLIMVNESRRALIGLDAPKKMPAKPADLVVSPADTYYAAQVARQKVEAEHDFPLDEFLRDFLAQAVTEDEAAEAAQAASSSAPTDEAPKEEPAS
jgi:hypothetical protein